MKPFLFCHDRMLFLNLRGENSTGIQCLITSNTHFWMFCFAFYSPFYVANGKIPELMEFVHSLLGISCKFMVLGRGIVNLLLSSDACCREISEILYLDEILVLHTLTLYIRIYIYIHDICKSLPSTSIHSSFL